MKKRLLFLSIIYCLLLVACDFQPESEKEIYYKPTENEIKSILFKQDGTEWGYAFYQQYSVQTESNKYKYSNKGDGYVYEFHDNLTYEYYRWENIYEYVWYPKITKSYSGNVEISGNMLTFYGIYNEVKKTYPVEFSRSGTWIKVNGTAYRRR